MNISSNDSNNRHKDKSTTIFLHVHAHAPHFIIHIPITCKKKTLQKIYLTKKIFDNIWLEDRPGRDVAVECGAVSFD